MTAAPRRRTTSTAAAPAATAPTIASTLTSQGAPERAAALSEPGARTVNVRVSTTASRTTPFTSISVWAARPSRKWSCQSATSVSRPAGSGT